VRTRLLRWLNFNETASTKPGAIQLTPKRLVHRINGIGVEAELEFCE